MASQTRVPQPHDPPLAVCCDRAYTTGQAISMSSYSRTIQWIVWGFLAAIILFIFAAYFRHQIEPPKLPVYSQISDFVLTNQNGQAVTLATLRGHVWIANVIFTRCPGPCPR